MSSSPQAPVHVIAHTHWDRSWYWPLERFRVKLVECGKAVVRELKARPEYRFTFDGQALMLEDYLHVCPEDTAYLQQAAREGRISIGPMYCLADVYCTGGEALIRNILIGQDWCRQFGGEPSRVLHMPDTFGITPSMPMIAAGFGMKAFSFMRGVAGELPGLTDMEALQGVQPQLPDGIRFFKWTTPDGSAVTTLRLRDGYASAAARRGFDPERGEITRERYAAALFEEAAKQDKPEGPPRFLLAGVDHQIPWEGQADSMEKATVESHYAFNFSGFDDVADELLGRDLDLPKTQDEFHGSGAASVLGGTISTRIYLKQTNAEIEQLLVNQVEPAAAFATLLGKADPVFRLINHAWKTLLVTHPHDDICGCSVDAVHRKNESDMQQAWESADALRRRSGYRIMQVAGANREGDDRPSFTLINFQAVPRTGPAVFRFDYEGQSSWGDIKLPAHYRVVNEAGEPVPFRELSRGQSVQHPRMTSELEVHATLPPAQVQRFYIEPVKQAPQSPQKFTAENEHLAVTLNANGSFDLLDKASGVTRSGLGLFSGQGDIGDSYDFSDIPEEQETVFDTVACELSRRDWSGGLVELKAEGALELPASTDSETRTRSGETVELPFTTTLVLAPQARALEVSLRFTNTAANHRLRWNLPLHEPSETSLAGLKFNPKHRPAGVRPAGTEAPRIYPEHPSDHFVAASGLACFAPCPLNYEMVTENGTQRLALTVCRSVSYLTNPIQGATRKGTHAGPHTLTPEARMLGRTVEHRLAVRPYAGEEESRLFHEAALWRAQPFFMQVDATMEYPVRTDQPELPPLFEADGHVIVSAFKPALDGNGSILRLFNATPEPQRVTLRHHFKGTITLVRLDETPDESVQLTTTSEDLTLQMSPYALRSLRVE